MSYANQVIQTYEYNYRNQLRYIKTTLGATILATFDYDNFENSADANTRRLSPAGQRQGLAELINLNGQNRRRIAYDYDNPEPHPRRAHPLRHRRKLACLAARRCAVDPARGRHYLRPDAGLWGRVRLRKSRKQALSNSSGVPILTASGSAALQNQSGLAYDQNDRMNFVASPGYDANGNSLYQAGYVSQPTPGEIAPTGSYPDAYDFENHLIIRHNGDVSMTYDGDGNRLTKTVSGVTTRYAVDDNNLTGFAQVVSDSDNGGLTATYIYGLSPAPICQIRYDPSHNALPPAYYGTDGQGTVRFLTDQSGNMTDAYIYDAFGILSSISTFNSQPATPNHFLYTGQQWDSDFGMY
jgi:YD repeat-containing protein